MSLDMVNDKIGTASTKTDAIHKPKVRARIDLQIKVLMSLGDLGR